MIHKNGNGDGNPFIKSYIEANILRLMSAFADHREVPLGVAMISCYRDQEDVRRFGFRDISETPDVLPWVRYFWEGVRGRLYMIGSITGHVAGDSATDVSISNACKQFRAAVKKATSEGAKVVLYAAATKRLSMSDPLTKEFPGVTFTLGDNFTGLLLGEAILQTLLSTGLSAKQTRALVIAPYGLLGGVALQYMLQAGVEVVGLGTEKRIKLLADIQKQHGIEIATSFDQVGEVDLVVACNSSPQAQLTRERIDLLKKPSKRLIVVDPNEPANIPPEIYRQCKDRVLRLDAGNAYSPNLQYILGRHAYDVLRLSDGVTWGCFAEAFLLAKHEALRNSQEDWLHISSQRIALMESYFGSRHGQFDLPLPSCYTIPVTDFNINALATHPFDF